MTEQKIRRIENLIATRQDCIDHGWQTIVDLHEFSLSKMGITITDTPEGTTWKKEEIPVDRKP